MGLKSRKQEGQVQMSKDKDEQGGKKQTARQSAHARPLKARSLTQHESQIMRAAVEIGQTPLNTDRDLSYWPKGIVQCALPHSNPGNVPVYARSSGRFFLLVQPGFFQDAETGAIESLGFPYGSYPRLVCSYMAREGKRTKSRQVSMGSSLSAFMHELGLIPTGGRWGTITSLRKQMLALLNARIQFGYRDQAATEEQGTLEGAGGGNEVFARRYELWWASARALPENVIPIRSKTSVSIDPNQTSLFENYVTLGEGLYEEMLKAFPCDMRILRTIKQSSLALDLYAWATSKVYGMKSATRIPWKAMHAQFGSEYNSSSDPGRNVDRFRKEALKHFKVIKALYPDFKYSLERGRIVVWPSRTSVLPMPKRSR